MFVIEQSRSEIDFTNNGWSDKYFKNFCKSARIDDSNDVDDDDDGDIRNDDSINVNDNDDIDVDGDVHIDNDVHALDRIFKNFINFFGKMVIFHPTSAFHFLPGSVA